MKVLYCSSIKLRLVYRRVWSHSFWIIILKTHSEEKAYKILMNWYPSRRESRESLPFRTCFGQFPLQMAGLLAEVSRWWKLWFVARVQISQSFSNPGKSETFLGCSYRRGSLFAALNVWSRFMWTNCWWVLVRQSFSMLRRVLHKSGNTLSTCQMMEETSQCNLDDQFSDFDKRCAPVQNFSAFRDVENRCHLAFFFQSNHPNSRFSRLWIYSFARMFFFCGRIAGYACFLLSFCGETFDWRRKFGYESPARWAALQWFTNIRVTPYVGHNRSYWTNVYSWKVERSVLILDDYRLWNISRGFPFMAFQMTNSFVERDCRREFY